MYKSLYYDVRVGKQKVFNHINDADVKPIKEFADISQKVLVTADYFLMVIDSCEDFLKASRHYGPGSPDNFLQLNRLLLNALNVYYVWQEYSKLNPLYTGHRKYIDEIDKQDVLLLADRIRHKMVHNSAMISEISYDVLKEKPIIPLYIDQIFPQKDQDGFNKKLKRYLSERELDFATFIKDFLSAFISYNIKIVQSVRSELESKFRIVMQYIPASAPDCYNIIIVDEDSRDRIYVGRLLEMLLEKQEQMNQRLNMNC